MKTHFVETALPCPCGKSSDAYAINADNSGKCFSCARFFPSKLKENDISEDNDNDLEYQGEATLEYIPLRNISSNTRRFYEAPVKVIGGIPVSTGYKYPNESYKIRKLNVPKNKAFSSIGLIGETHLFGKDKFPVGSKDTIVITEGEEDAMSVYEVLKGQVASVSVKNAATAYGDIRAEREYLNSFKKIILCFDNDKPGQEATKSVTSSGLFDYDKLYKATLKYKDPNEYLEHQDPNGLVKVLETAKRYTPDSIINSFEDIEAALGRKDSQRIGDYPFSELNQGLKGFHGGEFILLKGLEGIGKTEICRAILHHNLKEVRQATVFLEESEDITIKGVATYELEVPCNSEESGVSDEDILKGYKNALGDDDSRLYIHTHFQSEDESEIIDNIRFLVTVAECKVIYLDNLTMLVTGREGEDERLRIDRIIRRLRDLVNELHFTLFLVAHVNDNNQTRGSRLPDKLANTVLIMERNIESPVIQERNTLKLTIQKARTQGAKTGPVGGAFFDPVTYKLRDAYEPKLPEMR